MLTFHYTMDNHSLGIKRDKEYIGYINWHNGESVAKVYLSKLEGFNNSLSISEIEQIVELRKNNFKL